MKKLLAMVVFLAAVMVQAQDRYTQGMDKAFAL